MVHAGGSRDDVRRSSQADQTIDRLHRAHALGKLVGDAEQRLQTTYQHLLDVAEAMVEKAQQVGAALHTASSDESRIALICSLT